MQKTPIFTLDLHLCISVLQSHISEKFMHTVIHFYLHQVRNYAAQLLHCYFISIYKDYISAISNPKPAIITYKNLLKLHNIKKVIILLIFIYPLFFFSYYFVISFILRSCILLSLVYNPQQFTFFRPVYTVKKIIIKKICQRVVFWPWLSEKTVSVCSALSLDLQHITSGHSSYDCA